MLVAGPGATVLSDTPKRVLRLPDEHYTARTIAPILVPPLQLGAKSRQRSLQRASRAQIDFLLAVYAMC